MLALRGLTGLARLGAMEIQNKEGNWRPNSVWPKVEVIADFRTHSLCAVPREQKMSLYMACKTTLKSLPTQLSTSK